MARVTSKLRNHWSVNHNSHPWFGGGSKKESRYTKNPVVYRGKCYMSSDDD